MWFMFLAGCPFFSDPIDDGASELPHILVLTVDTLRADRLGFDGYADADTPFVDGLAAEGVVFRHAYAPIPRTTPALASLHTGLAPHHHGSREVHEPLPDAVPTLAERLSDRGYGTLGASANGAGGSRVGLDRGFDTFDDVSLSAGADAVTDTLLGRVDASASEPLFVWAHYMDPHFPYDPPQTMPGVQKGPCDRLGATRPKGLVTSNHRGRSQAALAHCSGLYDALVSITDASMKRLAETLADRRDERPWLVIFSADHGENLGEDGLWYEHGPSTHNASLRVPLVVHGPSIAPAVVETPVSLQDVTPTLLDLLDMEPLDRVDGRSLRPALSGQALDEEPVFARSAGALHWTHVNTPLSGRKRTGYCVHDERFSFCTPVDGAPALYEHRPDPSQKKDVGPEHPDVVARLAEARQSVTPFSTRQSAMIQGGYKLVHRPLLHDSETQLFDLAADPGEREDRCDADEARCERMREELLAWRDALPVYEAPGYSKSDAELLEALGYLDNSP